LLFGDSSVCSPRMVVLGVPVCLSFYLFRAVCYCFMRGCGYVRSGCFMFDGGCGDRDVDLGNSAPTEYLDISIWRVWLRGLTTSQLLVIVTLSVPMHPSMRARVVEIARSGSSQRIRAT
jgi:hypothetical protein